MIEARNLRKSYGEFLAVDDVSFRIEKGQIVGLLGHNGAGKTTIMKMLTGFLEPTQGEIEIDGLDVSANLLEVQQRIGYLPETCPVYPEMLVMEYLEYVAGMRGIPPEKQRERILNSIAKAELQEKACAKISTLSRGFQQRVGVAQAIIHSPAILILDEPTNGLDPTQIHHMRGLIRELSKTSTIIISTHILQEVQAVCDRVLILRQGQLGLDASLTELQDANSLSLVVGKANGDMLHQLQKIEGVQTISVVSETPKEKQFQLKLSDAGQISKISAAVARMVVSQNAELYALQQEKRDLDTIFREINSLKAGGSNA